MAANPTSYVIDDLFTTYSSPGVHTPGQCVEIDGEEYRFVRNGVTDAGTAGYPAVLLDTSTTAPWVMAYDVSDGLNDGAFVGVCLTAVLTSEYHWVKIRGWYHTCTIDDAIAAVGNEVCVGADGGFRAATTAELVRPAGFCIDINTEAATGASVWVEGI